MSYSDGTNVPIFLSSLYSSIRDFYSEPSGVALLFADSFCSALLPTSCTESSYCGIEEIVGPYTCRFACQMFFNSLYVPRQYLDSFVPPSLTFLLMLHRSAV